MSSDSADSPELEALFDSIVHGSDEDEAEAETPAAEASPGDADVYNSLGQLTRKLHDTLKQLGYDQSLKDAADAMPDTRDRLAYIAEKTEAAANRALNAVDAAKPVLEGIGEEAGQMHRRWEAVFAGQTGVEDFKALAGDTRDFLAALPGRTASADTQLTEIMMAQDFQDLTGQVIKKVSSLVLELEEQLVGLLLASTPPDRRSHLGDTLLNGPVVKADGRSDVVTSQEQVDDLLASLGF